MASQDPPQLSPEPTRLESPAGFKITRRRCRGGCKDIEMWECKRCGSTHYDHDLEGEDDA